jgi:hypothetical protein
MATDTAYAITDAYRWQRRLGNINIAASHCHIVADPAHPNVWDANYADDVTVQTDAEIDAVFRAVDRHLGHTSWRVIHTDCFTPDALLARLALNDFEERPVTIQMALQCELADRGAPIELRPVVSESEWDALLQLVVADHAEGRRTGGLKVPPEVTAGMVACYRAKGEAYHVCLAMKDGVPVA